MPAEKLILSSVSQCWITKLSLSSVPRSPLLFNVRGAPEAREETHQAPQEPQAVDGRIEAGG